MERYDEWPFHRQQLSKSVAGGEVSGCDLVMIHGQTLFMIEAKDYTYPEETVPPTIDELAEKVSTKGFDTLAGIFAGAKRDAERETARWMLML